MTSSKEGYAKQQVLSPQQEIELVRHIERLAKRDLPPTGETIRNFSSEVAKRQLEERWITPLINKHQIYLISRWTTEMDRARHLADSETKYRLCFDLLHSKMKDYNIEPRHTHNMDEKGSLIGIGGRTKRIFSKRMWERREVRASPRMDQYCPQASSMLVPTVPSEKRGLRILRWVNMMFLSLRFRLAGPTMT
jgi:hypothetical protein